MSQFELNFHVVSLSQMSKCAVDGVLGVEDRVACIIIFIENIVQIFQLRYSAAAPEIQVTWGGISEWHERWNKDIDTRLGEANTVLRELQGSVITKLEFSNTAKLSVFVPILTYSHESSLMTERMLFPVQAAETEFLRIVHGVMLHRGMRSCEICSALNVEPLLPVKDLRYFRLAICPECPQKR